MKVAYPAGNNVHRTSEAGMSHNIPQIQELPNCVFVKAYLLFGIERSKLH